MRVLISLILPIYNVEVYIETCLRSCCEQLDILPSEYEIILVNDETPDGSITVAKKLESQYPNHKFIYIERENGGLSAARNSGLQAAQGDYIWFIDSDDYIENNALSILKRSILNSLSSNIINFRHTTVYKDGGLKSQEGEYLPYECTGVEYLSTHSFLSAWTCIYKRSFLDKNKLKFSEGVLWEDSEYNLRALYLAKRVYNICDSLYYYLRRQNSISVIRATIKSTVSRLTNAKGLNLFFLNQKLSKSEGKIIYSHIANNIVFAVAGLKELNDDDMKYCEKHLSAMRSEIKYIFSKSKKTIKHLIAYILILFFLPLAKKFLSFYIHKTIKRTSKN